jgi:PAS domain S-box-containing protein
MKIMELTFKSGPQRNAQYALLKKDGTEFPGEISSSVIKDISGMPVAFVAITKDITERKKAEEALRMSHEQLKSTINSASELIMSVDKDGRITAWNDSIASKTGFSRNEMLLRNIHDENNPEQFASLFDVLKRTISTNKSEIVEHQIADKNENKLTLLSNPSIIKSKDNSLGGVVLVARDISTKSKFNQELSGGGSYLYFNESIEQMLNALSGFEMKGYACLCISRGNIETLKRRLTGKAEILALSENESDRSLGNPEQILKKIREFMKSNKKSLIFIDKPGYISAVYGFNALLALLYRLNDLIRNSANIAIVHVMKDYFTKSEVNVLADEFEQYTIAEEEIHLTNEKIEILKYISNKKAFHQTVNFNSIGSQFGLSRATTKRWLYDLQLKELIRTEREGNIKCAYITDKGNNLIMKSSNSP